MTSPAVGTGIVAFIEARLDEREKRARYATEYAADAIEHSVGGWVGQLGRQLLAEVAKDRAILALHQSWDRGFCHTCADGLDEYPCQTVRLLAAIDADHPDFDPDWKPVAT